MKRLWCAITRVIGFFFIASTVVGLVGCATQSFNITGDWIQIWGDGNGFAPWSMYNGRTVTFTPDGSTNLYSPMDSYQVTYLSGDMLNLGIIGLLGDRPSYTARITDINHLEIYLYDKLIVKLERASTWSIHSSAVAPELIGLSSEEAKTLVRRAGLNWQQVEVNHDTIPLGTVISQSHEPETAMTKGDSIVVTISLGPVEETVPDLEGMTLDDARAKLRERGFSMAEFKRTSMEPVGTVISQTPAAGEPWPKGMEVDVTISGGSTMVPDLSGKTLEQVTTLLADSNLAMGKVEYEEVDDDKLFDRVVAQQPTAGTMATLQAQVTLTVARKGKSFHSEIGITLPAAAEGRTLRVTLMEGGQETEQISTVLPATGSEDMFLFPLSSDLSGMLLCKVYMNGLLLVEQEVEFQ